MKYAHLDGEKLLGWYTKDIHGNNIPTPNVEVTEEVWNKALEDGANAYVDSKFVYKDFSTNDEKAASIRIQRNQLLEQSDWTQAKDVALSNDADWKTYRQALRDIPAQSGFPTNVTFPTKPGE